MNKDLQAEIELVDAEMQRGFDMEELQEKADNIRKGLLEDGINPDIKEAKRYLYYAVYFGYMPQEEADKIEALPVNEMLRTVKELGDRGDYYANNGTD